jgi:hypothetical protein
MDPMVLRVHIEQEEGVIRRSMAARLDFLAEDDLEVGLMALMLDEGTNKKHQTDNQGSN